MNKKFSKKLGLQKMTLASLNDWENAAIRGGIMDPTNQTGCQTECVTCTFTMGGECNPTVRSICGPSISVCINC